MIDTPTGDVRLLENENNSDYNIASVLYNHTGEYVCEASNEMGVFSNSTPARLIGENILTLCSRPLKWTILWWPIAPVLFDYNIFQK